MNKQLPHRTIFVSQNYRERLLKAFSLVLIMTSLLLLFNSCIGLLPPLLMT